MVAPLTMPHIVKPSINTRSTTKQRGLRWIHYSVKAHFTGFACLRWIAYSKMG
ncbi:hypothetical protein Pjdr2_4656 [Paenibacillus sp. JDR-2]|nr:hypothetical protein Pjdr2_4656 [Paenibacillus sp. JDR-2]